MCPKMVVYTVFDRALVGESAGFVAISQAMFASIFALIQESLPDLFLRLPVAMQNGLVECPLRKMHGRPSSHIFLRLGLAMPKDASITALQVGQLRPLSSRTQT